MRRWLRVLVVGVLTVLLSIDSASACRFLRSRCRPRCRVVTCRVIRQTAHHCVPCDGSAHAVIIESSPMDEPAPAVEHRHTPAPQLATPKIVETPQPAVPQPVKEPLQPLEPIAPVSGEKPLAPATPLAPQPQFKSAAEILAESAERDRLEKAAVEAAKPAVPVAEPQFKTAAEILAESATEDEIGQAVAQPPMEKVADKAPAPEEEPPAPVEPAPEPAPKQPAPKQAEENLFDEADDAPAAEEPAAKPAPMKKAPAEEPVEDLFGEPEATKPAEEKAPEAKEPADDAPTEEKTEKAEDDPFAVLDTSPEPVRRWVDSTGRHETIGRLVEVHPDRIRILKSNGRFTTVPMERLSRHDQSYVIQVGERIAAKRPPVTDTAQR